VAASWVEEVVVLGLVWLGDGGGVGAGFYFIFTNFILFSFFCKYGSFL
jgi:hypothetical protein